MPHGSVTTIRASEWNGLCEPVAAMLRSFVLLFFMALGCTTLRRDDGSGGDGVEAKSPGAAACAMRQQLIGVVAYDPRFHTLVHPPHRGTFVAPSVKVGDAVAARTPLAEIVWGPNREKIVAPVQGVIVHAGAAIGSYLREGDTPFVIADPLRLAVRFDDVPPTLRHASPLELSLDGASEPIVVSTGTRDGKALVVALPLGVHAKLGSTARLSLECNS